MRLDIDDLGSYAESLAHTLESFELVWPLFEHRGLSKDAAFTGWMTMCMIDFLSARLDDDEDEDWKLAG